MQSLWRRSRDKRSTKLAKERSEANALLNQEVHTHAAVHRLRKHLLLERGHEDVERVGLRDKFWTDIYHHALTARWPTFIYVSVIFYILINLLFALLYLCVPGQVSGLGENKLLSLFFFSVQTLSTVGYGGMVPTGGFANAVVAVEVLIGMMINALATGLVFARFARPRARLMFSQKAVIASENGIPALSLRIANLRSSVILAVDVEVALSRLVMTSSGHLARQFDPLPLVQSHMPMLRFAHVLAHVIGPESPLHGKDIAALEREEAEIVVTVTGTDEALGQTVFARTAYSFKHVEHNHRFVDILVSHPSGRIVVDYSRFHDIEEAQAAH